MVEESGSDCTACLPEHDKKVSSSSCGIGLLLNDLDQLFQLANNLFPKSKGC